MYTESFIDRVKKKGGLIETDCYVSNAVVGSEISTSIGDKVVRAFRVRNLMLPSAKIFFLGSVLFNNEIKEVLIERKETRVMRKVGSLFIPTEERDEDSKLDISITTTGVLFFANASDCCIMIYNYTGIIVFENDFKKEG